MADINIQRKKSSPSLWILVLIGLVVLGLIGYFLFRSSPDDRVEPTTVPATTSATPASAAEVDAAARATPPPADGGNGAAVADMAVEEAPATPEELANFAANEADSPDYGRRGLQMLSATLGELADRADLRDATVSERRNDLTSAISRSSEPNASLRPGFVAVAGLVQAMQQKAYPDLEKPAAELSEQARQLSGRSTAADQPALQAFFTKAAEIVRTLNEPAS
ncbi:PLD nuclease N-terminal domain-containing protein [Hymenobacter lucidus]|uniref:PLD nuclease N-terminal domain-containing protein n=1 Tax=Hymenobacter lucidus TaxID=2880930 RepID=A0ABS8AW55_9BACT|nr:PLD nuclease N-terminal domain-containing protein [Hymenobacter lucidus]MCB2409476.1 PLD nuclease N-terminal domain-containing protein [Hymenobacter lucidus]